MNLRKYNTLIFDCDGVILNSNDIKTKAFIKTLSTYSNDLIEEFISYHKANGGVSRYKKIKYFLNVLAPKYNYLNQDKNYEKLISIYSDICKNSLLLTEEASGLDCLKSKTINKRWLVVSGGDQSELREVFLKKNISKYFDGGIFGSPDKKEKIINREIKNNNIIKPALFLGDSKHDFYAAKENHIDFIFLSAWTEYKEYKTFCSDNGIIIRNNINEILKNNF